MNFWNNRLRKREKGSPLAKQLIKWHPIYIELIEGSGERLAIAIAGGTTEEVRVRMIEGFHESFGPQVEAALAARRPLLNAVTAALRNGSIDLLASADTLGPGLFVGKARQIMTSDIDASLEAAVRITSSVFNAGLSAERASEVVESANNTPIETIITEQVAPWIGDTIQNMPESRPLTDNGGEQLTTIKCNLEKLASAAREMDDVFALIKEIESHTKSLALSAVVRAAHGDESGKVDYAELERIAKQAIAPIKRIRKQGDSIEKISEQFTTVLMTIIREFPSAHENVLASTSEIDGQSSSTQGMSTSTRSPSTVH
jgi:hypothetical protein